jgi:hypothetical protein
MLTKASCFWFEFTCQAYHRAAVGDHRPRASKRGCELVTVLPCGVSHHDILGSGSGSDRSYRNRISDRNWRVEMRPTMSALMRSPVGKYLHVAQSAPYRACRAAARMLRRLHLRSRRPRHPMDLSLSTRCRVPTAITLTSARDARSTSLRRRVAGTLCIGRGDSHCLD